MLKKREGSSSLECLIVLIVLCTIFIGFCFFIKTVNIFVNKRISSVDEKRKIDVILESIYEDIKDDVSPEGDSLFDSVWVRNNSTEDGYLITLESLSGKINLNFLDSNVLLESGLSTVFNDSKSIREIESIRSERLLYSYDEIKDYISEENFSKYFSFYGFANINIMSEKSLELLVNSLTDSFCGSELNQKRNNLLANKQLIKTETEYNLFCGINYLDIFPYINLDAAINVNFIDEDCLYKLINYAGFGLISKKKKIDTLLSLREIREITQEDIITILGITKTEYKDGEISKQINPLGLEMGYTYENKNSQIIKTIEYKDKNILIKSAKSIYTSDLLWESDGNGNTTKYSYDKLGRITKKEYPEGKIDYIVYDDKCKTITIKNEDNNAYKKYYYDAKKNLIQQDLYDYSSGEPVISTVLLSYDKNDNVVAMTDPNNNTTRYSYDVLDRLVLQTNADSTKKTVDYDDNLSIRTVCDENGNIVMENLAYDGLVDRQEKQNTNETQVTSYTYDAEGRVVKMQDSLGQIISTEYSVFGEVSKITRPKVVIFENNEVSPLEIIEYNDLGLQIIKKVGYENNYRVEEITYDSLGRKESVCRYAIVNGEKDSEERVVSYTYDANGNVLTETDEEGNVKFYTYTARNQKKTETDAMGAVISYEYDRNDKMIKVTDAMGFVAEYTYDDLQRLVKATLPALAGEKREVKIVYDKVGNTLSMLEPDGKNTVWEYDNRNRKISETITGTNADAISKVWTYDNLKNIKTLKEGNLVTTYIYDKVYNLVETNFPDGQRLIKQYDKLNRVTNEQNANGAEKVFEYNSLNQITKHRDEEYTPTEFKYDVWGNLVWRKEYNPNGNGDQIWNITYNNFNEPIEEIKNDGTNWKYEYNKKGLLTKKIEPNGTILLNLYDSCDRIVQEKRMGNGKTEIKSYNYDANGFMNQASDNGVTSLINYKNGEYKANAYNLTTSHTTTISGTSFMTEYEYDQGLRISAIKYPDELSVCYEYNGLGQLTEILNKDGTKYATKGTYDSLGRLVSITAGNGKETTRTWDSVTGVLSGYNWGLEEYAPRYLAWDNVGNIISISKGTSENVYTNTYQYDILGRLLHEKNGAKSEISSKNIDITRFMYVENDVSGKKQGTYRDDIVKLDYYAGSVIVDLEEVQTITTMKIFGKNDRISPEHFEVWSSEDTINWQKEKIRWENDFSGWNLIFDDNTKARYVKLHSLWDERDQNYNAVDKSTYKANIWNFFEVSFIANGKTNSWSYDSRGNRISESVSFGDNPGSINYYDYYQNSDLIKKAGNWYFNYDKNGNLIAKGSSAILYPFDTFASWDFAQNDGELWVYEYDLQNRMINAFYSGKGKANLKHRASYSYDYRGLLVQKNYNDYDLSNYIQLDNPSSSKEITEYYEYSPDGKLIYNEKIEDSCVHITDFIWTDTTLWSQLSNNNVFYHHSDHLGTSELISDSNGNIVWHADYEAFGSVMNKRGEENFTPNYTGKFFDKTTGLYYFNARWYDCELGRFTSQDPARDGVNWWAYCGGNPLKFVDPDGREILPITSRQYQNSVLNKDLNVGSEKTGFYNRQNNYVTNTIGRFGCLFVCAVNVGNSYNQINSANYSEQQVSSLAKNDNYFDFFLSRNVLGTDFVSGPKHIGMLLADMTGKEFNVMRVSHKNITELSIEAINSDSSKSSYIIADVGGHFINISGIDSEGNISYFDPYIRSTQKNYSMNDIKGAYFIMEMEAYKKLGEQDEMEN